MGKKDKTITALEVVHAALKPLKPEDRKRILISINALLQISPGPAAIESKIASSVADAAGLVGAGDRPTGAREVGTRPLGIRELIQDKGARSHPELITLFAYFREKYQGQTKFSRDELKPYYQMSREHPPGNYDRDFVEVVRRGWIHEDGENSYITTRGIEAVESGFAGAREGRTRSPKAARGRARKPAHR